MEVYFTLFDYIVLGLFGLSFLIGLKRGVLLESIMFIAWFAAVFVVIIFNDMLTAYLGEYFKSPYVAAVVSFVALCVIPLVIGLLLSYTLALVSAQRFLTIGFGGRLFGGLLGLGKNILVVFVVTFVLVHTPLNDRDWFKRSHSVHLLAPAVKWMQTHVIIPSVSEEIADNGGQADSADSSSEGQAQE